MTVQHGGRREGAGRKPTGRALVQLNVEVTPDQRAWLDTERQRAGDRSLAGTVRRLIDDARREDDMSTVIAGGSTDTREGLTTTVGTAGPGQMHWMVTGPGYDPCSAGVDREPLAGGIIRYPADDHPAIGAADDKAWALAEAARAQILARPAGW